MVLLRECTSSIKLHAEDITRATSNETTTAADKDVVTVPSLHAFAVVVSLLVVLVIFLFIFEIHSSTPSY